MSTKTVKSRPGGPKVTVTRRPPKAKTGAPASTAPAADEKPGSFLKSAILPAAACGILLAAVSMQEGADLAVGCVIAVCMTAVIAGMIKLKKALYGG
jgi:hypothetical protein